MRIGFFIDSQYPVAGDSARSLFAQVVALQAHGHTTHVFCPETSQPLHNVVRILTRRLSFSREVSLRTDAEVVDSIVARYKLDLVHSLTERGAVVLAQKVAQRLRIPHVHTFYNDYAFMQRYHPMANAVRIRGTHAVLKQLDGPHITMPTQLDGFYTTYHRHEKLGWQIAAQVAAAVDHYFTPLRHLYEGIDKLVPQSKGSVIPTGVDVSLFGAAKRLRPDDAPFRLVYVGRMAHEKHVRTVMDAYLLAAAQSPSIELTMIGGGELLPMLQRKAKRSRFAAHIQLPGSMHNQRQLAQHLSDADALIIASHHRETQGLIVLEAAAAGLPIIYCDEHLEFGTSPKNAILTKPDKVSLAQGILQLASDHTLTRHMGQASRAIADMFSVERVEQQNIAVYEALVKKS